MASKVRILPGPPIKYPAPIYGCRILLFIGGQGESQLLGFRKDENAGVMPSEHVRPRGGAQPEEV